jgi:hypothetical protein
MSECYLKCSFAPTSGIPRRPFTERKFRRGGGIPANPARNEAISGRVGVGRRVMSAQTQSAPGRVSIPLAEYTPMGRTAVDERKTPPGLSPSGEVSMGEATDREREPAQAQIAPIGLSVR